MLYIFVYAGKRVLQDLVQPLKKTPGFMRRRKTRELQEQVRLFGVLYCGNVKPGDNHHRGIEGSNVSKNVVGFRDHR